MKKNVSLISVKVHEQKGHTQIHTHTYTLKHTHTEFLGTLFCKVLALLHYQLQYMFSMLYYDFAPDFKLILFNQV